MRKKEFHSTTLAYVTIKMFWTVFYCLIVYNCLQEHSFQWLPALNERKFKTNATLNVAHNHSSLLISETEHNSGIEWKGLA